MTLEIGLPGIDHVLHLGYLGCDVVGGILQIHLVTRLQKLLLHVAAVLIPALQILGRHGYTDLAAPYRLCFLIIPLFTVLEPCPIF